MDVTTLILASIFILPSLNSDSKYYLIYPLLYYRENKTAPIITMAKSKGVSLFNPASVKVEPSPG